MSHVRRLAATTDVPSAADLKELAQQVNAMIQWHKENLGDSATTLLSEACFWAMSREQDSLAGHISNYSPPRSWGNLCFRFTPEVLNSYIPREARLNAQYGGKWTPETNIALSQTLTAVWDTVIKFVAARTQGMGGGRGA